MSQEVCTRSIKEKKPLWYRKAPPPQKGKINGDQRLDPDLLIHFFNKLMKATTKLTPASFFSSSAVRNLKLPTDVSELRSVLEFIG